MIPMTPSASVAYRELESEESTYWPSVSPSVPLSTSGDEGAGTKVRKPYTITKQRERWTEEEHQKFLEALKLYGRAWRRIEEHIGSKTAVQIRSHAQKFFSKIERDVTHQGGAETGVAQVIDIPPPRPKRKPTHPYPRKAGRSFGKISEDECPLATAGSISSSSGISSVNIVEGCSKSNVWEQDDTGDACHQDAASKDAPKANDTTDSADAATRPWGIPKPANAGSSPAIVAPTAAISPPSNNQSPVPVPVAFPAAMPWARIFGGAAMVNPAMMNPAMMSPPLMNPAVMNPPGMGMMMPWAAAASGASNAQGGMENGGAVSVIAATIAAASAWWAMQGGMPPTVIHPTMGAVYMGGAPPLAIPAPYLFSPCAPQEVIIAAATAVCGDAKEGGSGSTTHVGDDGPDNPSSNGNASISSALRRAERAQRVKELKARRMGSGNHLLSVSSDVCPSLFGGSGTTNTAGQVTTGGNISSGTAVSSLFKGVSLPANLSKVKQTFHDFVRKDRELAADADDGGDDKRKRLRLGGRASNDTIMVDSENSPSITTTTDQSHLEKVGSISGSSNLPGQFTKILKDADRSSYGDEATPTDASQSCGSDGSEGAGDAQADGNERRGPSSNSSACGNVPGGGTDRSASSDGSSEGEATVNIERPRDSMENNVRSSSDPDVIGNADGSRQYTFNEFLPVRKEIDRHEKPDGGGGSSRLQRAASIDGEQRKEVTERGQIAFQALFKRDTLPRTFSPPPGLLALATEPKESSPLKKPSSACNITRSRSVNAVEFLELRSPRRSRNQDSAFNVWEQLRGTSSASKLDRCESGVSILSSGPSKCLEELQSSEHRRNTRKGRTHSHANNWLQLAPTSSRKKDEEGDEDESADSGADDQACLQQQQKESFVCKLDLSVASQPENDRNDGSDTDGPVITSLDDLSPRSTSQSLSLSIGSCLQQPHHNNNNNNNNNTVSSVSNRTVKYSGLGFVPYQRATPSHVESPEEKN